MPLSPNTQRHGGTQEDNETDGQGDERGQNAKRRHKLRPIQLEEKTPPDGENLTTYVTAWPTPNANNVPLSPLTQKEEPATATANNSSTSGQTRMEHQQERKNPPDTTRKGNLTRQHKPIFQRYCTTCRQRQQWTSTAATWGEKSAAAAVVNIRMRGHMNTEIQLERQTLPIWPEEETSPNRKDITTDATARGKWGNGSRFRMF